MWREREKALQHGAAQAAESVSSLLFRLYNRRGCPKVVWNRRACPTGEPERGGMGVIGSFGDKVRNWGLIGKA